MNITAQIQVANFGENILNKYYLNIKNTAGKVLWRAAGKSKISGKFFYSR
jgi:hypothetical protein